MSSNSVCNHTRDEQIGLPLRSRPILLSLVWLQTELDSTQSYYHYLSTGLIIWIGHRKEIRKVTFRASALRRSESDEGLSLETPARNVSFQSLLSLFELDQNWWPPKFIRKAVAMAVTWSISFLTWSSLFFRFVFKIYQLFLKADAKLRINRLLWSHLTNSV